MKKAIEYYKQAATWKSIDQKHNDAIVDLGYIYENGVKDSNGNYI